MRPTGITFIGVFLVATAFSRAVSSQAIEAWVSRDDTIVNGNDSPVGLVVDASGNVYVAGTTAADPFTFEFLTIKYDPDGNELWLALYEPGETLESIAADDAGNFYVTGRSDLGQSMVKYDSDGNELWASDFSLRITADIAVNGSGDVYISSWNYLVKYALDGRELWNTFLEGRRRAMAVEENGSVYAIITSQSEPLVSELVTVKYDASGNKLWAARLDGGSGAAVAIDAAGDVYVMGGYEWAMLTLKYSSEGEELWSALGADLAIDPAGQVYVAGRLDDNMGLVKYDADGNELWGASYADRSETTGLALHDNGEITVVGGRAIVHYNAAGV
jgi:hypothetical protein